MASFLFTAKDNNDTIITDRIRAEDLDSAKQILVKKGFQEIKFFESIASQHAYDLWANEGIDLLPVSPELDLQILQTKHRFWLFLKNNWIAFIVFLMCITWNVYSIKKDSPFEFLDYMGFVCSIGILLFYEYFSLPSYFYNRILTLQFYKKWTSVIRLIKFVLFTKKIVRWMIPTVELEFNLAECYAGLGQLTTAINIVKKYEHSELIEHRLFLDRVAELYYIAKQIDEGLRLSLQAIELGSKNGDAYIGVAYMYIRYKQSIEDCQKYLMLAKEHEVSELAKIFLSRCIGLIHYHEGNYAEAVQHLHRAIINYQQFKNPSTLEGVYDIYLFLFKCYVQMDHREHAMTFYHILTKYYKRSSQQDLLTEIEQDIQGLT